MIIKDFLGREQDVASTRPNMNGMIVTREVLHDRERGPMKEQLPCELFKVHTNEPVDWPREGVSPSYDYEKAYVAACYGVHI